MADFITDKTLIAALRSFRVEPLQERILADDAQFLRSDSQVAPLVNATLNGMPNGMRLEMKGLMNGTFTSSPR